MADVIITPSTGKIEFVDNSGQTPIRYSFTLDSNNGIKLDAPLSASAVIVPSITASVISALAISVPSITASNAIITGNLTVTGSIFASSFSASNIYITSSTLTVTDNILLMNAMSPYQRYAGIQMYDSGSGTLSHLLWDGQGDYFFLSGSSVNGKIITGPDSQANLTTNYVPKATAGYKLGNSVIYDDGTNIGIGTTIPAYKLHVEGTGTQRINVVSTDNSSTGAGIYFQVKNTGSLVSNSTLTIDNTGNLKIFTGTSSESEKMRVTSTGCVGIGTTSVRLNSLLDVYGSGVFGTSAYGFYIGTDATGTFLDAGTQLIRMFAGQTERMRIDTDGNVGIGTTTSVARLHVNSTTAGATLLRTDGTSGTLFTVVDDLSDSLMSVNNSAGLPVLEVFADDRIVAGQYGQNDLVVINNKIGIGTNNPTAKLYVSGSTSTPTAVFLVGNVGIGTTSPSAKLTIVDNTNGGTINLVGRTSDDTAAINFRATGDASTYAYIAPDTNEFRLYHNDGFMSFYPGGSEKVRITSTGNVGIGTTSPSTRFHVYGTGAGFEFGVNSPNCYIETIDRASVSKDLNTGYYTRGTGSFTWNNGAYTERMRIDGGGNVGIGITVPAAKLHCYNGSSGGQVSSNSNVIAIESNGNNGIQFLNPSANNANINFGDQSDNEIGFIQYQHATDAMRFRAGGTTIMSLVSGNVGIGTSSPNSKLEVYSTSWEPAIRLTSTSGSVKTYGLVVNPYWATGSFHIYDYTLDYSRLQISTTGNVGIGVGASNPGYTLEVNGTQRVVGNFYLFNTVVNPASNYANQRGVGFEASTGKLEVAASASNALSIGRFGSTGQILDFRYAGTQIGYFSLDANDLTLATARHLILSPTGNVGIGTSSPAYKLDVNGTVRLGGIPYDESVQYDDFNYFSIQPYIESETTNNVLPFVGTAPTFVTLTNTTAPFSKVMSFSAYAEAALGDYIPVQAGETVYGEIWAYRATGAAGTAGVLYCGIARYDKDKKMIDSNLGLTYFIASAVTVPSNSTWTKYSNTTTLPTTHTSYNGSDGGPVRYIRPYIIVNNPSGTILTYIGGWKIRKTELTRDSGVVSINGNVGIGTTSPAELLNIYGTNKNIRISNTATYNASGTAYLGFDGIYNTTNDFAWFSRLVSGKENTTNNDYKGYLAIQTNSTVDGIAERMRITSTGSVGIGTTSPASKLQTYATNTGAQFLMSGADGVNSLNFGLGFSVNSQTFATIAGYYTNSVGSGAGDITFYTKITSTALSEKMRIQADGNVGIGTASPVSKLQVQGKGLIVQGITGTPLWSNNSFELRSTGGNGVALEFHREGNTSATIASMAGELSFYTDSGTERMRISQTSGNVGIGTSSPGSLLYVHGTNPFVRINNSSTGDQGIKISYNNSDAHGLHLTYNPNSATSYIDNTYPISAGYVFGDIYFRQNVAGTMTTRMTIKADGGGNVGIGTTTPSGKLHVNSTTAGATLLRTDGTSGTLFSVVDDLSDSLMSVNNSAGLPVLEVFADDRIVGGQYGVNDFVVINNKVGIGTNNPSGKLHVTGSASTPAAIFLGSVGIGTTSPTNALTVSGNANITGALTKGSGTFLINHPDPAKPGWKLQHSFVESPTVGDNIYRYIIDIDITLSGSIELPSYWKFLNENPQIWISPVKHFGVAYGEINEEVSGMNVYANNAGKYNVLLIGTRKDPTIKQLMPEFNVEFESK